MGKDEQDRPVFLLAPIGQQMAPEDREHAQDHQIGGKGCDQGRGAGPEQGADAAGARDSADAEEPVETGHQRAARGLLHDDGLDVHHHIRHADSGAEEEQGQGERGGAVEGRQQRQSGADAQTRRPDRAPAAEACGKRARERHGDDGPGTEAEQEKAELCVVHAEPRLREGDERRPGGEREAGHEEGRTRRMSLEKARHGPLRQSHDVTWHLPRNRRLNSAGQTSRKSTRRSIHQMLRLVLGQVQRNEIHSAQGDAVPRSAGRMT